MYPTAPNSSETHTDNFSHGGLSRVSFNKLAIRRMKISVAWVKKTTSDLGKVIEL